MPVTITQPAVSTQFVQVQVIATQNGGNYDPTGDTVQMAFIPASFVPVNPGPSDWQAAQWENDGGTYWASCLVGPQNGGVNLAAGAYFIYVKITDSPAVPVLQGALLNIT